MITSLRRSKNEYINRVGPLWESGVLLRGTFQPLSGAVGATCKSIRDHINIDISSSFSEWCNEWSDHIVRVYQTESIKIHVIHQLSFINLCDMIISTIHVGPLLTDLWLKFGNTYRGNDHIESPWDGRSYRWENLNLWQMPGVPSAGVRVIISTWSLLVSSLIM